MTDIPHPPVHIPIPPHPLQPHPPPPAPAPAQNCNMTLYNYVCLRMCICASWRDFANMGSLANLTATAGTFQFLSHFWKLRTLSRMSFCSCVHKIALNYAKCHQICAHKVPRRMHPNVVISAYTYIYIYIMYIFIYDIERDMMCT